MKFLKAVTTVGSYTLLSRVFGFVRDILIASVLGAGGIADAFFLALRLPNLFRRLFAEGALAAAFVPIFTKILEQNGRDQARAFAEQVFSVLILILAFFVAFIELVMPWVMIGLAPGFAGVPGKMELATEMSRIAFPYILFISVVSIQSGILNALGRFAAAAAAPILFNFVLIIALLGFSNYLETPGHVLSWGVFLAGLLQFFWLTWNCKSVGFPFQFHWPKLTEKVKLLGARILPVVFGTSLYQINLLIGTILATLVADGAVSYLYYADRVTQLPLGVVGVAVGTALLPMLSQQLAAGDDVAAAHSQNRGLEFAFLLVLPASAALLVIAQPIITVLFERGAFGPDEAKATADALKAYAAGLPAYVLIRVLSPGFFAREDTKTPVQVAAVAMGINVFLNLIFMQVWGYVGLALASSFAAWVNVFGLVIVLRRRGHLPIDKRLQRRLPRIVLASVGMGISLFLLQREILEIYDAPYLERVSDLALLIVSGLFIYWCLVHIFGAARWQDLKELSRRPGPDHGKS